MSVEKCYLDPQRSIGSETLSTQSVSTHGTRFPTELHDESAGG